MSDAIESPVSLSDADLLSATRELVGRSRLLEADLVVHLGEIEERRLYLDTAYPSMFAFCMEELGFSEDAAYNRLVVARAGRRLPAVIEALRSGRVHLAGLRLLAPYLTELNHEIVLLQASGKSKRMIEELVARLAPSPPVRNGIRRVPESVVASWSPISRQPLSYSPRAVVVPVSAEMFEVRFAASRELRDKLLEAQALLRHGVPNGDLATIIEKGLDLLIEKVKKKKFGIGRKPRRRPSPKETVSAASSTQPTGEEVGRGPGEEAEPAEDRTGTTGSRHIPDAIKRAVYERDGGRCAFVDERGRRCGSRDGLEFEHEDGFARTHRHDAAKIHLFCRAHNQHAADKMYGRAFMERARKGIEPAMAPQPAMASQPVPGRDEGTGVAPGSSKGESG